MGLKSCINSTKKIRLNFAQPAKFELACNEVSKLLGNVTLTVPSSLDVEKAYFLAEDAWKKDNNFNSLSKRVLRLLPWAFFIFPKDNGTKFGHLNAVLNSYLSWLQGSSDVRSCINLFHVFLRDYPVKTSAFELLRTNLEVLFSESSNKRIQRLSALTEQHYFFSDDGPDLFANKILKDAEKSPLDYYSEASLTGSLQLNGFGFQVYLASLVQLKRALRNNIDAEQHFGRFCELSLESLGIYNYDNFLYKDARVDVIETLLEPYAGGTAAPQLKDDIREFLLKIFGDIRINSQKWNGVSGPAKQVMRRWLVAVTLEDFFNVLDKTADTQWRYRKAFWSAYLDRRAIDGAWVVLGNNARNVARGFMKSDAHGQLLRPYTPDQSVLILQIGDLIVAEWSHNGSCRIWDLTSNERLKIPKLYGPIYDAATLRTMATWSEPHVSAKTGAWQKKVRKHIYNATGINIPDRELMP